MRCLHILPMNKLSGAEKMALLICKNMKEYEPVVVCGGQELKKVFEKEKIKSYSLSFSNKDKISTLVGLKNIIKENHIKILHAHDNNASLNAYMVKKLYRLDVRVVSHIHNCYPWLKIEGLNKKIDSFLRPRYDYNIACGNIVYDFYNNNTSYFDKKKAIIIPNAIDVVSIDNINFNDSDELIKKYKIPTDKTILGFIGRIEEQKGIIPFIKEISLEKEQFNDCRILIVGSGNQENKVRELLKELELEELFILVGFQEDVYRFYSLIDIFFLPSLYEGLPMVILEAMAFKKAIISMSVGSISEVIKDNDTGILIENNSIFQFVNKLEKLKDNKELQIRLGNNAYRCVNKKFNINSYINKLNESYERLFKGMR